MLRRKKVEIKIIKCRATDPISPVVNRAVTNRAPTTIIRMTISL